MSGDLLTGSYGGLLEGFTAVLSRGITGGGFTA